MQFAASLKNQDIVRILLENGSDPNAVALPPGNERETFNEPERDNGTAPNISTPPRVPRLP